MRRFASYSYLRENRPACTIYRWNRTCTGRWYLSMSGDSLELIDAWGGGVVDGIGLKVGGLTERRKRVRTRLHWPVFMFRERLGTEHIESGNHDLTSSGFYGLTRVQLLEGEQLVCSIKIPTHDPHGKNLEQTLECRVRVL